MAKKVNKTVVGGLTAVFAMMFTAVGVYGVYSLKQDDPQQFVDRAEEAAAAGDYEQARIFFNRAYNVSENAIYLVRIGEMSYAEGNEDDAAKAWNFAITNAPALVEGHEKLLNLHLEISNIYNLTSIWLRVKKSAESLLAVDGQDENANALYGLGSALVNLPEADGGNRDEGIRMVRRAAALAPDEVDYSLALVWWLKEDDQPDEAETLLKRLVASQQQAGEEASRVRYSLAQFLALNERYDEAEQQYADAVQLAGTESEDLATAKAQFAKYWIGRWFEIRSDKDNPDAKTYYENATKLLQESIDINEKGFMQYMLLAELRAYEGKHDEAVAICKSRIDKDIVRTGIKRHQAKGALYMLELKAAEESLAHAQSFDSNSADYKAAVTEAEVLAEMAQAELPDRGPALHVIGKICFAQGRELEAIEYLQNAREAFGKPDWKNDKMLAELLLRNNQPGAAKEAITSAIADPGAGLSCYLTLGKVLLATKEYAAAVDAADQVLRRAPNTLEAQQIRMDAYAELGQQELADLIRRRHFADSPQTILKEAQRLYDAGKYDESMARLKPTLEENPGSLPFVRAALAVLDKQNDDAGKRALIDRAVAAEPEVTEFRMLAIDMDTSMDDATKQARRVAVLESIDDPFERNYRLAMSYQKMGNDAEYGSHLEGALDAIRSGSTKLDVLSARRFERDVVERLFTLAVARNDLDRIDAVVEEAVTRNLDGADGLIFRGRAYMGRNEIERAVDSFKLALEKQPTNANLLTLLGQTHMLLDPPRPFEAEGFFEQALESNPNIGKAHKGVAVVALQRGDNERYASALQKCEELIPNDPWVQKRMLVLKEKSTPFEAIERREKIRAQEPGNLQNLFDLASLYAQTGQPDKAAECHEVILADDGKSGGMVLTAATFFRDNDRVDRAEAALRAFIGEKESDCDKADATLLLAEHFFVLGRSQEAEAVLTEASELCVTPDVASAFAVFFKRAKEYDDAVRWYDRAIELADKDAPEHSARMRRDRIEIHFRASDNEAAREAIAEYTSKFPDDPNGLLLQSNLNTVLGDIDEAISHLDRFLDRFPLNLNAKLQRARLYGAQGRWPRAIQELEQIRSNDPKHRNYESRVLLADAYALVNELNSAYSELESILRDDPGATTVASHLVQLYYEHERYGDAIRICTSAANRYPNQPVWVKSRADVRNELGDAQAAINDYRRAAEMSNHASRYSAALLAAFAEHERIDEGIDYYESTIPTDRRGPYTRMRYGELLAKKGRNDDAVVEMLKAFDEANFRDAALINALINTIVDTFGIENAVATFNQADPPQLGRAAKHVASQLMTRSEQYSEALATMQSLLQTADTDLEKTTLLAGIGNVHEMQENWAGAQQAYEQLLEIDGRNVIGLNNLAYLLSDKLSKPSEAVPYARRAALLFGAATVRDTLGWTLVQLGDFREAIAILTGVLETNPRFIPSIYHLAEAYRRSGDNGKAKDLLESAMNLINDGADDAYKDRIKKRLGELDSATG